MPAPVTTLEGPAVPPAVVPRPIGHDGGLGTGGCGHRQQPLPIDKLA